MVPGILGLQHAALRVHDIEAMASFYKEVLGMTELFRLSWDDGRLRLVYLRIAGNQFLELFPDADDTPHGGHHASGVNHLALEVEDMDAVHAEIVRQGVEILQPLKDGTDGNRQLWIADPEGNRIEFMQMRPGCMQYAAIAALEQREAR